MCIKHAAEYRLPVRVIGDNLRSVFVNDYILRPVNIGKG